MRGRNSEEHEKEKWKKRCRQKETNEMRKKETEKEWRM
jgi:hypothetical protein